MTGNGLSEGLSDMWRSVLMFLPAALAFIAILVVGYIVARLLRKFVAKALHRAGFDRAVDRGRVGQTLRNGNVSATDLCAKIVFYAVMLFALQLAFGIWGPNPVSDLLTAVISWLPRAFVAIVVIVVAAAIAGAVHDLIVSALGGLPYGRVLARAASIVIITLGVIAALDQIQVATSVTQPLLIAVLATVAGVLIVGVGGGLVRPMQRRWEIWLDRATAESAAIRDHARAYADERRREEARLAEEARRAAEAERESRRAAEAERESRRADEGRETRRADEARLATEAEAEEARRDDEAHTADEARKAKQTREAQQRLAEADHGAPRRSSDRVETVAEQQTVPIPVGGPQSAEETQVIPPRQADPRRPSDNPVPGFDRAEDEPDSETTTVIRAGGADTTIVNPGPNDTIVIGSGTEQTQPVPPLDADKPPKSGG
jgi:hypothetical protein